MAVERRCPAMVWITPLLVTVSLFMLGDLKVDLRRLSDRLEAHIVDRQAHAYVRPAETVR